MKKLLLSLLLLVSCSRLDVQDTLGERTFSLSDHRGAKRHFPQDYRGRFLLVSYIYTQCPDICPMTTQNMKQIAGKLGGRSNISYILVTFDPERDSVAALRSFAESYNIADSPDWHLLTGKKSVVDSLMSRLGVQTLPSEENSELIRHTDRITFIDREGNIRANYPGSRANIEQIIKDIQQVAGETQ